MNILHLINAFSWLGADLLMLLMYRLKFSIWFWSNFKPIDSGSIILINLETVVANADRVYSSIKLQRDARATKKEKVILFIDSLKRIGPKIDPCGTPEIPKSKLAK